MLELLTGTGLALAAGLNAWIPLVVLGALDRFTGLIELRLICDSVHTVTVRSRGVRLDLVGEPRYVEEFEP